MTPTFSRHPRHRLGQQAVAACWRPECSRSTQPHVTIFERDPVHDQPEVRTGPAADTALTASAG